MSLEQEQRTLDRRQRELTDLQKKLAREQSKLTAAETKANAAQTAATKARTESTRSSKLRSYQSALRDKERAQKEIASLQGKIAVKQKEVNTATAKVGRERQRIENVAAKKRKKDALQLNRAMGSMNRTIEDHATRLETLENMPEKVTVLYLGTSPEDEVRLPRTRCVSGSRQKHETSTRLYASRTIPNASLSTTDGRCDRATCFKCSMKLTPTSSTSVVTEQLTEVLCSKISLVIQFFSIKSVYRWLSALPPNTLD